MQTQVVHRPPHDRNRHGSVRLSLFRTEQKLKCRWRRSILNYLIQCGRRQKEINIYLEIQPRNYSYCSRRVIRRETKDIAYTVCEQNSTKRENTRQNKAVSKKTIWKMTVISQWVSDALLLCLQQPCVTSTSRVIEFPARSFFNIIALNKHSLSGLPESCLLTDQ